MIIKLSRWLTLFIQIASAINVVIFLVLSGLMLAVGDRGVDAILAIALALSGLTNLAVIIGTVETHG